MKRMEIDGKWYDLVPTTPPEELITEDKIPIPPSYYACETECGTFKFSVLLDDKTHEIRKESQSVEYTKDGETDYWDNSDFLRGVIYGEPKHLAHIPKEVTTNERRLFSHLVKHAETLGWI